MKQTLAVIAILSAVQAGNPAKIGVKLAHETSKTNNLEAIHYEKEFNKDAAKYDHISKEMFHDHLYHKEKDVLKHGIRADMDREEEVRLHADYLDH